MTKFKVGDRVVGNETAYEHRVGTLGIVEHIDHMGNHQVKWDSDNSVHYVNRNDINHHGQTLADLDVKPGDVVECVSGEYIGETLTIDRRGYAVNYKIDALTPAGDSTSGRTYRIISRAADEWTLCPDDYTEQNNHECTYYMGEPTHYRVIDVPLVDVERRVAFDGRGLYFNNYKIFHNAVWRGQTRNGKPVGQWVIDMDGDV